MKCKFTPSSQKFTTTGLAFCSPHRCKNGNPAVQYVHWTRNPKFFNDLQKFAEECIVFAVQIRSKGAHFKWKFESPSRHVLLELYIHSVLYFGHSIFMSNLTLEGNHLLLKASIFRSTGSRSHPGTGHNLNMNDCCCKIHKSIRFTSLYENPSGAMRCRT